MLLELAVGDAYGSGFEYRDAAAVAAHNTLERYVRRPNQRIAPGCYTDDTQMSIAIAEAISSGEAWTRDLVARAFVRAFKRDPREGYAAGFYQFLHHVQDASQLLEEIDPRSDKSGAAMRAGPIGVFASIATVKKYATLQARVTHDTTDGINAAVAAALMTHYFLYQLGPKEYLWGPKSTWAPFLNRTYPGSGLFPGSARWARKGG
jgi:ADP-ribosylglycohydrolase